MMTALQRSLSPSGAWFWLLLAILLIALDQATKLLASDVLSYAQPVEVLPFLNWTLLHNKGAAFSFLSDAGGWQRWFFTLISVGVSATLIVWLFRLSGRDYLQKLALALILSGALGNLWDRLLLGYVVDFIQVHYDNRYYFPAFNIADAAITVGAILMIYDAFFIRREEIND
ncbi:MAG: signal peptidase II [Porticoccaceae bacterium]|nr:signal peptidase II [Porticoccaceae bacterium]